MTHPRDRLSRRRILAGVGLAAVGGLAGCLAGGSGDESAEPAEPIALTDGQACDACGMTVADHYGPAGQLFYADGYPEDRDGPARFDSVHELVAAHAAQARRGRELRAAFVTDYSSVDYDLDEREGTTYISSHVRAEDFTDATAASFVVDGGIEGAMGEDVVPFSSTDDAEAFAAEHGGSVATWEELSSDESA
ncbi:nitrous oxide reductase accessory protein NosL [Halopiger xanaduensis]|uniref:NosL family protein n=1 Tax=Halopiger xanaduensis (strain DSM 18323 / JCM 14033 / SH-6) TaxID=797210 RepID=F8D546_HALXS|nr:nitrous oxide reductase accessory protein NosL [Halopiger xanaduensis]AEH36398.1 NosL family protein [Halopiger xanaduensis SH-6]